MCTLYARCGVLRGFVRDSKQKRSPPGEVSRRASQRGNRDLRVAVSGREQVIQWKQVLTRKFFNPSKTSLTSSPPLLSNHANVSGADLPWNISTRTSGFTKPRWPGTYHCHSARLAT